MTPRIRTVAQARSLRAGILDARSPGPIVDEAARIHARLYARAFVRTRLALGQQRRAARAIALRDALRR